MLSGVSERRWRLCLLTRLSLCLLFAALPAGGASCAAAQEATQDGERHFQRGRELRQAGDLGGARREFERAAELLPRNANVFYLLAVTLDELGETEDARSAFEKSLALDPDHKDANRSLKELEAAGGKSRGIRPPGDGATAEEILRYFEQFHSAIMNAGDTYPVPPKPEQMERMVGRLEEAKKTTSDPDLKNEIDKAMRERVPLFREASKAFWGGALEKKESKPAPPHGGAGGGTGPPPPANSKP